MREYKVLKELVASITDWETRQKVSTKPFRPRFLDLVISPLAPQYYSKEELGQLEDLCTLYSSVSTTSRAKNNKRVTKKRSRQIEEQEPITSKAKNKKSVTKKRSRQIEEQEPTSVNKKPRKTWKPKYGPAPDLPVQFKNRISELNGHDIKFVMHKKLTTSDLDRNKNRLSMPLNEIMCDFLTEAETSSLGEREGTARELKGVEVTALGPNFREFTLNLKKWEMKSVDIYNLIKNWNKMASANDFEEGDEFHIWSFRVHDKLYFLLNKL